MTPNSSITLCVSLDPTLTFVSSSSFHKFYSNSPIWVYHSFPVGAMTNSVTQIRKQNCILGLGFHHMGAAQRELEGGGGGGKLKCR